MISANIWCECFDCIYNVDPVQCTFKGLRNIAVLHKDDSHDFFLSSDDKSTCNEFLDYRDTEDYQTVFWKSVLKNHKNVRIQAKGKKIVIDGRIYFSDTKEWDHMTDERTGMLFIRNQIDKIPEFIKSEKYKNIPDVMTLEEET